MAAKKMLTNAEIAFFCDRLALTIQAGLPPQEGLAYLRAEESGARLAATATELRRIIEDGQSLAAAVEACGRFPSYVTEMTRIGEASGRLDEVLSALAAYYEQNHAIEKSVKNAVLYPAIMALMMLVVLAVLVVKVLPIFADVYRALGSEMSGPAAALLSLGSAISQNAVVCTILLAAILLLILASVALPGARRFWLRRGAKLFKKLHSALIQGRFASSLALMLKSGMNVDEALSMTVALVADEQLAGRIHTAQGLIVHGGKSFPAALREAGLFSGLQSAMLELGFQTGTTDEVMARIARDYEDEAGDRISRLVGAIEPAIVAILSILVGLVLLAVILPLMGVMASL